MAFYKCKILVGEQETVINCVQNLEYNITDNFCSIKIRAYSTGDQTLLQLYTYDKLKIVLQHFSIEFNSCLVRDFKAKLSAKFGYMIENISLDSNDFNVLVNEKPEFEDSKNTNEIKFVKTKTWSSDKEWFENFKPGSNENIALINSEENINDDSKLTSVIINDEKEFMQKILFMKDRGYETIPCDEPTTAVNGFIVSGNNEEILYQCPVYSCPLIPEYGPDFVDAQDMKEFLKTADAECNKPHELKLGFVKYNPEDGKSLVRYVRTNKLISPEFIDPELGAMIKKFEKVWPELSL